jgi:hypothetical protein
MSPTGADDALAHGARIRDLILSHSGGWADGDALRKFRELSRAASLAADDAECSALLSAADHYASDLFSRSAHHHWARGKTCGADILRLCILGKLEALRARLMHLRDT